MIEVIKNSSVGLAWIRLLSFHGDRGSAVGSYTLNRNLEHIFSYVFLKGIKSWFKSEPEYKQLFYHKFNQITWDEYKVFLIFFCLLWNIKVWSLKGLCLCFFHSYEIENLYIKKYVFIQIKGTDNVYFFMISYYSHFFIIFKQW